MGLPADHGRNVRPYESSRSNADVVQLSGAAVRTRRSRGKASAQEQPHTVYQVCN